MRGASPVGRGPAAPGVPVLSGPGRVISILDERHFDFSYLAGSASETVPLVAAINVVPYKTGQLVVRLHENAMQSGQGASFTVKAVSTAPSPEDPREFARSEADASVQVDDVGTDVAPKYFNTALSAINGPYMKVEMVVAMGGSSRPLGFTVSIDLVLRENA